MQVSMTREIMVKAIVNAGFATCLLPLGKLLTERTTHGLSLSPRIFKNS